MPITDYIPSQQLRPSKAAPIRSFVLPRSRMSLTQKKEKYLAENLPLWAVPQTQDLLSLHKIFGRQAPCHLEIGYGNGEALARYANNNRGHNFLGVEVYPMGIAAMLGWIEKYALTNVRLVVHDAMDVMQRMLPPSSLSEIRVFFPDPWPKRRHHKRRLIQAPCAKLLVQTLQSGGRLLLATDDGDYAQQMTKILTKEEEFDQPQLWRKLPGEQFVPPEGFSEALESRFAKRAVSLGHTTYLLSFHRL